MKNRIGMASVGALGLIVTIGGGLFVATDREESHIGSVARDPSTVIKTSPLPEIKELKASEDQARIEQRKSVYTGLVTH